MSAALSSAVVLVMGAAGAQAQVSQSDERMNMERLGHTDLQGRPAYMPNMIQYPDGRTILFVGMHSGVPVPVAGCATGTLPNPLKAGACEINGTIIIDVTDPKNPVEKAHIPSPAGGQAQSNRMCLSSQLPGGTPGKVFMLRNVQGGNSSGYEVWDVTDVSAPVMTSSITGIRSTHKPWWECNTGIAYLPGSKNSVVTVGTPLWRQAQSMLIYDWSKPASPPVYIRTFGLPGAEPSVTTGAVPTSLHGAISTNEHPQASTRLTNGATPDDIIGNRIYAAWGVGDDGVMTIIDRKKLLPAAYGGTWVPATPNSADSPTRAELFGPGSPTVGYYLMSPDQGGHTSVPIFGVKPPSFARFNEFATRDIVILVSEATADGKDGRCNEAPHPSFIVDITVENSMAAGPFAKVHHDPYHGPMGVSTMWVKPQFGEKYPRGNYCARGARFGAHSNEENFRNPLYGKLTAVAYFNAGVRIYDIREPFTPTEVGFYVPVSNAKTAPAGYMTNNVEIDNRGYIYIVDRNGAGLDILQVTGCVQQIVMSGGTCPAIQ